ncbi:MAG: hypothetical protein ACRDTJ_15505 [Pseudonocardiaceae bacterium]
MASLVYFEKVDEDDQRLRYKFGFDDQNMTRTLALDKTTRRSEPDDGQINYEFLKAFQKISGTFTDEGRWPERGCHAS